MDAPERSLSIKSALLILACILIATGCSRRSTPVPRKLDPSGNHTLFQFSRQADIHRWKIKNDDGMSGRFRINEAGNAVFAGDMSKGNGDSFSSVQFDFPPLDVSTCRAIFIGLKGDGNRYQLRIGPDGKARHVYASDFDTCGDWEVIRIPLAKLAGYSGQVLAQIQLRIGNDQTESFRVEIDRIWIE